MIDSDQFRELGGQALPYSRAENLSPRPENKLLLLCLILQPECNSPVWSRKSSSFDSIYCPDVPNGKHGWLQKS